MNLLFLVLLSTAPFGPNPNVHVMVTLVDIHLALIAFNFRNLSRPRSTVLELTLSTSPITTAVIPCLVISPIRWSRSRVISLRVSLAYSALQWSHMGIDYLEIPSAIVAAMHAAGNHISFNHRCKLGSHNLARPCIEVSLYVP